MSQRGGGFRGRFKGRERHSPYGRGGGGGGSGGYQYRKVQRNNGGGGKGNTEVPAGASGLAADVSQPHVNNQDQVVRNTPGKEAGAPSPSHAYEAPGHTPSGGAQGAAETGDEVVKEKKYSVKARLFVGNLPRDTNQGMVRAMFEEFGEVKEVFVQKEKSFGFVRMVSYLSHSRDRRCCGTSLVKKASSFIGVYYIIEVCEGGIKGQGAGLRDCCGIDSRIVGNEPRYLFQYVYHHGKGSSCHYPPVRGVLKTYG